MKNLNIRLHEKLDENEEYEVWHVSAKPYADARTFHGEAMIRKSDNQLLPDTCLGRKLNRLINDKEGGGK